MERDELMALDRGFVRDNTRAQRPGETLEVLHVRRDEGVRPLALPDNQMKRTRATS